MPSRLLAMLAVVAALFASSAWAAAEQAATESSKASPTPLEAIRARLARVNGALEVINVTPSPIQGLYLVELKQQGFVYATADGSFLLEGDMYHVSDTDRLVNLTDARRNVMRREMLAHVSDKDKIVFAPKGEVKAVVDVFTDVDCGYCRKLHKEMPRLNELGIEIRYLAYPRTGIGSPSYDKIVTAWCSDDPQDAITRLKRGEELPPKTCKNPVADEYKLGNAVGVHGTPALVLQTGELLPGYVPADELAKYLGIGG